MNENESPKIITNNHLHDLLSFYELPKKYQKKALSDYDYMDDINESDGWFIYRSCLYHLDDFMAVHNTFYNPNPPTWMQAYDGYLTDTFFSGVLIRYPHMDYNEDEIDTERVICATFYS